jgi:hypothetical protein
LKQRFAILTDTSHSSTRPAGYCNSITMELAKIIVVRRAIPFPSELSIPSNLDSA